MYLTTDDQTIEDLRIFGKRESSGVYDLYNHTRTRGGQRVLENIFRTPLSDTATINLRGAIIENFSRSAMNFPFDASLLDMAEKYLADAREQTKKGIAVVHLVKRYR